MGEKICSKCEQPKPLDAFAKHRSQCRACIAKDDKARKQRLGAEECRRRQNAANRRYESTDRGREFRQQYTKQYRKQNPEKARAHWLLGKAIARGEVVVTGVCEQCGATSYIDRHHDDYSKPYDFRELCRKRVCHKAADDQRREREQSSVSA